MRIKHLFSIPYALLLGLGPSYASDSMTSKAEPLAAVVLHAVRSGISTLSPLPAERDDQDLIWAAWSDHGPADHDPDSSRTASHPALIRQRGSSVSTIWSRTFPEAYEPKIQMLYGILPDDRKIVLFKYRLGADEAVATFYGLTANDAVTRIGSVAAQTVELRPEQANLLWSRTSPVDPPDCHRLDPTGQRLVTVGCR